MVRKHKLKTKRRKTKKLNGSYNRIAQFYNSCNSIKFV